MIEKHPVGTAGECTTRLPAFSKLIIELLTCFQIESCRNRASSGNQQSVSADCEISLGSYICERRRFVWLKDIVTSCTFVFPDYFTGICINRINKSSHHWEDACS